MVDEVGEVAAEDSGQIIDGVVDAMVGDAALREIVGADFGRAVAGRHKRLAP